MVSFDEMIAMANKLLQYYKDELAGVKPMLPHHTVAILEKYIAQELAFIGELQRAKAKMVKPQ